MLRKTMLFPVTVMILLPLAAFALPQVAVLDAAIPADMDPSVIVPITDKISEELVKSGKYVVLDRASVEQVLKEKEFQLSSGLVKTEEIRKAGEYLGADFVVAARASKVGSTYFISARMIDVKTGAITAQTSVELPGDLDVLLQLARTAGNRLAGGVVEKVAEEQFAEEPEEQPKTVQKSRQAEIRDKPAPLAAPRWIVGFKAGGGFANIHGDPDYAPEEPYASFGIVGGGYLDFYVSRAMGLATGAYFVQKGLAWDWYDSTFPPDDVTTTFTLNYIEIPMLVKLILHQRTNFYAGLGGFVSLYLNGTWEDEYWYYTEYNDSGELINISGTDFGAIASVGFDFPMSRDTLLNVEVRYSHSFTTFNTASNGATPKNGILALLAGLGWGGGSR